MTIGNRGALDAGGSSVELSQIAPDGATVSDEVWVDGVSAGGSATATFRWQAEPGAFTLKTRADAYGVVAEGIEDNNEYAVGYGETALADLVVVGIVWEPERPALGEEVSVGVVLKNAGAGDALASDVRLFVDGIELRAADLPALSTGESSSVSFPWIAEMGTHTFSADLDQGDRVVESDETNNASETFEYGTQGLLI